MMLNWQYNFMLQDISEYLPLYMRLACELACDNMTTCIYYQFYNHSCYLCIKTNIHENTTESWNHLSITEAYIKIQDESVIFPETECSSPLIPVDTLSYEITFNVAGRVAAIDCCGSSYIDFIGIPAGFTPYINQTAQPTIGCVPFVDAFDTFEFAEDEVVLMVDIYSGLDPTFAGSYFVIRAMTIATNRAIYGPYGITEGFAKQSVFGYNLVGLVGRNGYAIDALSLRFERC